jgi:hypothetical protein
MVQQYVRGQEVSLGCGTLILIALIVAIFSNGGGHQVDTATLMNKLNDVERDIKQLQQKMDELNRKVK